MNIFELLDAIPDGFSSGLISEQSSEYEYFDQVVLSQARDFELQPPPPMNALNHFLSTPSQGTPCNSSRRESQSPVWTTAPRRTSLTPATATIIEDCSFNDQQFAEIIKDQSYFSNASFQHHSRSNPVSRRSSLTPADIHMSPVLGRQPRGSGQSSHSRTEPTAHRQRQRGLSIPYSFDVRLTMPTEATLMRKSRDSDAAYDMSFLSLFDATDIFSLDMPEINRCALPSPPTQSEPSASDSSPSPVLDMNKHIIVCCDDCANRSMCKHNPEILKWHRHLKGVETGGPCGVCGGSLIQELTGQYGQDANAYLLIKRPFTCKICATEFARSDRLLAHSHAHTGKKPFPCTMCSSSFSRKARLQSHMTDDHVMLTSPAISPKPTKMSRSSSSTLVMNAINTSAPVLACTEYMFGPEDLLM